MGSLNETIERAARLLATDPAGAEREARSALALSPRDARAVLILGSARRRLGDPRGALALLEPLARALPRAADAQFELGLVLAALGEVKRGIEALRRATALNPDLAEAWRAMADILFRLGEVRAAEAALAQHARACVSDPRLKPAARALFGGRPQEAERLLAEHVGGHPDDVMGLHLLAHARLGLGRFAEAETVLARALELAPDFDGARFNYATALFQQQKGAEATAQMERLLARAPSDPAYRNLMAACLGLIGDYARAGAIHESLAAEFPAQPRVWLNWGLTLRTTGSGDRAAAAFRRAIRLAPGLGEAWWSLANLKTARFDQAEVDAMGAQLARNDLSADDRACFHYALAKAMEDRADPARAFEHYAAGAKLRREALAYDADETTARSRRARTVFTRAFLEERRHAGAESPGPIFVVGLPRSGSTLVEQILASHPAVEGLGELPYVGLIAQGLDRGLDGTDGGYPERLAGLGAPALKALGKGYLAAAEVHRRLGRPVFVDKMPDNFQHLGLVLTMLPGARIVDVRRHPMAAGFAAFKQHFTQGQAFACDLADIGRYYRDYVELMAHFDEAAPGRVHRVIYEDLVEDPEGRIRRLLDACGLPFESACLSFWETDRPVKTVSSEQVRRPIFREGLDRWRAYAPWLGPLEAALGPTLEAWRGGCAPPEPAPDDDAPRPGRLRFVQSES